MTWIELDSHLSLEDLGAVAAGQASLRLAPAARARMQQNSDLLERLIAEGQLIYGLNTGFGPLADRALDASQAESLQRGLIYHLCTGVGPLYSRAEVRAIMAARLANLVQGWSGVGPDLADFLLALLERDLTPAVPQQGTVGASGDLTPLAHIALAAIGEGWMLADDGGPPIAAAPALARAGLAPLQLKGRAALALVNGTSAMTAIAALNGLSLRRAIMQLARLTLGYGEVMRAHVDAWHPRLAEARPHPGQRLVTHWLWTLSQDSARLRRGPDPAPTDVPSAVHSSDPVAGPDFGFIRRQPLPQDAYSLRCAPQELGAALDLLDFHNSIVTTELNAACDNPLVDTDMAQVHHGGNFYGQPVAYAADALAMATVKLAVFAERAIARITDERLNDSLPPFLTGGRPGLDSGFMGAQVTASALVAEMRALAMPASIQSIPTNANNQDVVTLGTIAARLCRDLIAMLWRLLAIEALVVAQGMDLCYRRGTAPEDFSASSRALLAQVRAKSPPLDRDRPLSAEIETLAQVLRDQPLANLDIQMSDEIRAI
ncbi:MAG: HAL/PAL/TAL family ammonia-lyase [Thermochromatium sp.]